MHPSARKRGGWIARHARDGWGWFSIRNAYMKNAEPTPPCPPLHAGEGEEKTKMKAKIKVTLKNGVLDPQGKAIEGALGSLGFSGVNSVRQGKFFEVDLAETDQSNAKAALKQMCEKLIANTVIENYEIEIN